MKVISLQLHFIAKMTRNLAVVDVRKFSLLSLKKGI